ncbi:uncharacterized protein MONBRDRAFT_14058 [Monosiga brevicollis MX1]|uniref:VWFA domain-containing protein n=1 Tax=Monosiga brevicollis TaxID=81824 RepID=A9UPN7_MONBE|nr:uncharacterized protein MONBRDRAFT_14058 [Monosiga brevicollis MX1]EDQ92903.1 predicted protein [Monosiga brevicollis MX1]|eukprot:XP_001742665.1 hypothetical protein [Monosiga brevicollis MX1]
MGRRVVRAVAQSSFTRRSVHNEPDLLRLGGVEARRNPAAGQTRLPVRFLPAPPAQSPAFLRHLRWMLQKDILRQDMFLIGPPGAARRRLALAFCEALHREVEYVALTRDTTENDLKQRKELRGNAVVYEDQCAVRAARHGRVLVLDGIEKAERNLLPLLNNLLENREMHLEDGTFLVSPERYKVLQGSMSEARANAYQNSLIPVHEDFRVIALGLPSPPYPGHPLDPPLRSRFQARWIDGLADEHLRQKLAQFPRAKALSVPVPFLNSDTKLQRASTSGLQLPVAADTAHLRLAEAARLLGSDFDPHAALLHALPYSLMTSPAGAALLRDGLQSFHVTPIQKLRAELIHSPNQVTILRTAHAEVALSSGSGPALESHRPAFTSLPAHEDLLQEMFLSHATGDLCLVGPSGCGKSMVAEEFCRRLAIPFDELLLHKELTLRELLQTRTTDQAGNSCWQDAKLVQAVKNGRVVLMDGIHRLHPSVLGALQSLIHDRDFHLPSGTHLMSRERWEALAELTGLDPASPTLHGVELIHPSFRIVALAEPDIKGAAGKNWITEEIASLFEWHICQPLCKEDQLALLGNTDPEAAVRIHGAMQRLHDGAGDGVLASSLKFSTRMMLRIAHRVALFDGVDLRREVWLIERLTLAKYLPSVVRDELQRLLPPAISWVPIGSSDLQLDVPTLEVTDAAVRIGDVSLPIKKDGDTSRVPHTVFYPNESHLRVMNEIMKDLISGEPTLLIGNQGVGKNKIVDGLLQLLQRPREYLQLHRDSTVESLSQTPTIENGQLVYEDSPLIRAVREGSVLVIDEADKASTDVTGTLKTFVETGLFHLPDGRMIVPHGTAASDAQANEIRTHPDFRLIVLANRPGYPFLGNDFFSTLGDLFSCHAVENPGREAELKMLQAYAPAVDASVLEKLASAFAELRQMSETGQLDYPFSLRELVSIARHINAFPEDGVEGAINNVLDFDSKSIEKRNKVVEIIRRHGVPYHGTGQIRLQPLKKFDGPLRMEYDRYSGLDTSGPKHGKVDEKNQPHVGGNTWAGGTGGRDTAGLGGKGGPYRLDAGHDIHQLSDEEKAAVPEHIQEAAREMGRKAFADRLREIGMSEHEAEVYHRFVDSVRPQIGELRELIASLRSSGKERAWLRHQAHGDLDDNKLIDGLAGEQAVYRRRVEQETEHFGEQQAPKRVTVLADVSASMYRFNSMDQRLQRAMECACMLMEGMRDANEERLAWQLIGHSGDSDWIPFVTNETKPASDADRLKLLKQMMAHSQFCWPGDNTLPATAKAIQQLASEEADERFVILLTDANLERYGIPASELAHILNSDPDVKAFVVMIGGTLHDQAETLRRELPAGKSFVCLETQDLPSILQQIFSTVI